MAPQREWFEKDYYEVLGVPKDATEKDITRAYRKLAKQYHPDANPGDTAAEERFKEISAAHDVLGDAEKRKEYDEVREMVASGVGPGGPGGFGGASAGGFGGGGTRTFASRTSATWATLGDLFGKLFGGGGRGRRGRNQRSRRARSAAQDIETELHLDFLDAVHGITTSVNITSEAPCSRVQRQRREAGHASRALSHVQRRRRRWPSTRGRSRSPRCVPPAAVAAAWSRTSARTARAAASRCARAR